MYNSSVVNIYQEHEKCFVDCDIFYNQINNFQGVYENTGYVFIMNLGFIFLIYLYFICEKKNMDTINIYYIIKYFSIIVFIYNFLYCYLYLI